uniref:C2H2-type domain-containing protein n=1 Tax=Cacopsylla melanoneura TaxID=428564 RepID=A0A8D8S6P4_9HEMI
MDNQISNSNDNQINRMDNQITTMDNQINSMDNQIKQLDPKWNCLICDQSSSGLGLSTAVLPKSGVTLQDSLIKVLKTSQMTVPNIQTHNVCDVCLNLFDDLELLESQCSSLRNTLLSGLRKTCHLYSILLEDTTASIGCQTDEDLASDFPLKIKIEEDIPVRSTRGRRKTERKVKGKRRKSEEPISELSESDYDQSNQLFDSETESKPNIESDSEKLTYESTSRGKTYTRKKHPCKFCKRLFKRPGEVKNHILVSHLGKNPNQCAFCSKTFNSRNGLYVHLKRLHNVEYSDRMEIVNNNDTKELDKDLLAKQKEILEMGDQMSFDDADCKDGVKSKLGVVSVKCLNEDGTIEDEEFIKDEPGDGTRQGERGKKKKTRRSRTGESDGTHIKDEPGEGTRQGERGKKKKTRRSRTGESDGTNILRTSQEKERDKGNEERRRKRDDLEQVRVIFTQV